MDLHIFLNEAWNFLKWLIEKAVIPFAAAFGGARFAYKFSKKIRREETIDKVRSSLKLVKSDVVKGKHYLQKALDAWKRDKIKFPVLMPVTYYARIDPVELGQYITPTCVEHIRNIYENVFSVWNDTINELARIPIQGRPATESDWLYEHKLIGSLVHPEENYIRACDTVMNSIDEELKILK